MQVFAGINPNYFVVLAFLSWGIVIALAIWLNRKEAKEIGGNMKNEVKKISPNNVVGDPEDPGPSNKSWGDRDSGGYAGWGEKS